MVSGEREVNEMIVEKTYRSPVPSTTIAEAKITVSGEQFELILNGLRLLHRSYATQGGYSDLEESRTVSDLYYGLKY